MRLLVVSQHFWPENFRVNDLVAELVRRGHEVTVLTGLPNYPDGAVYKEFQDDPQRFASYQGARLLRVPVIARGTTRLRLALNFLSFAITASTLGAWRARGQAFDAIFVFAPSPVTVALPALWLRWLKRAPVACWVLDLWPETLQAVGALRGGAPLAAVGAMVRFIYRRCDLILVQSRSFIAPVTRYCADDSKIRYLPNWAEPLFADAAAQPASEVPPRADTFNVMFAGNIGVAQDFPAVLQAARHLIDQPQIRWLIVGDGRMAAWVREEVQRLGLQDRFLLLGQFPVERMPSFYKHADALLVCLRDEPIFAMTIPGKLQSYLAAGVPVVAMLNGEGADVVTRTHAGIACAAGDSAALAAAVLRLATLPLPDRAQMGTNAVAASRAEFDRDSLVSRLESWLGELAAGRRGLELGR